MDLEAIENKVSEIISLLEKHKFQNPNHEKNYDFLIDKYSELKNSLNTANDKVTNEVLEWNKLFASRIIYDGIGVEEILNEVDNLNKLL
jgi:hypothetical protein